jgi:hypothetical protein
MKGSKPPKPETVDELQELVAEQIEAIEPGLRLLGTRVLLGGATIDVLALDAGNTLTLISLGFNGDDAMLLRALEAYSWCLEYPDALRQQHPGVRLSPADPPRILFIAERLDDAFLRKIRHLRFNRVDCLEFRFGLQFTHVEELRGTHAAEAPPARAPGAPPPHTRPAPRGAPSRPGAPFPRPTALRPAPLRATRAEPPRVEPPRRQARQAPPVAAEAKGEALGASGDRRGGTGIVDDNMVRTVREYLQREFPTALIYDFYDHDRGGQVFELHDSSGAVVHSAGVADDLLDRGIEAHLRRFLEQHQLGRVLREAGEAGVSVTRAGLRTEPR